MSWTPTRHPSGYFINEGPSGTGIFIESDRIDDCMEYYKTHGLNCIGISRSLGYREDNLDFLKRYPDTHCISVGGAGKIDINGIYHCERSLTTLWMDEYKQPLDLARFPKLREYRGHWHPELSLSSDCRKLTTLALWKYKPKSRDLTSLAYLPALEDLSLVQSTINSLRGVGRYEKLKRLELSYLSQLHSIEGIVELKDGQLEVLDCQKCKKITDHNRVQQVPTLRVVRFNDCGEMPNIRFLNDMPNMEDFRFVHTNVIDGDLTPLFHLKSAGFFKKRHYSHTPEEIDAILGNSN